jgi:hypothetical protein
LCVVYNHYDVLCWHVQDKTPEGVDNEKEIETVDGRIIDVMEPTLFYYNNQKDDIDYDVKPPTLSTLPQLYAAALIYPSKVYIGGGACDFNIPYCAKYGFGAPVFTGENGGSMQYPLTKRWFYFITLSGLVTGDRILTIPAMGKSLWMHKYSDTGVDPPPNREVGDWYVRWTADAAPIAKDDYSSVRASMTTPGTFALHRQYMFVSIQESNEQLYTDINVTIIGGGISGILKARHDATTFRETFTNSYDLPQYIPQLPEIDANNSRVIWFGLQTGNYRDRWFPDTFTHTIEERIINYHDPFHKDSYFSIHRLNMTSPHFSTTRTGIF